MRIILTGANGFIGNHIQQALLKSKHHVIACTHQQKNNSYDNTHIESINIDYMDLQSIEACIPTLKNVDVLINCVGIITESKNQTFHNLHYQAPAKLFKACEKAGVQRIIQISALGADETAIVPYQTSKKAADNILRKTTLDWFILRPSLVYGTGGTSMTLFQQLSNLPIIPVIGNGEQMIQPVHISDLIATVIRCLDSDIKTQQTINVVGDQPINYQNWLIHLRNPSKGKPRFIKIPLAIIMKLSLLGKLVNHPFFTPDNLRMLQQNNIANSSELTKFLGRRPLSINEGININPTKPVNLSRSRP